MSFLFPFLRVFFQLLYHQFAWTYDWVAAIVSIGLWKEWVMGVMPYLDGLSVLELGHGPGHLQSSLISRGIATYGLDASPQMGRIVRGRLHRQEKPYKLVQAISQAIPLACESFDQVVATFPTEYITDPKTLKEIWRILRTGGRLVVLPAAWITGQGWMERYAAGLFRITKQAPDFQRAPVLEKSPCSSSREEVEMDDLKVKFPLIDLMREAGFRVQVEWKTLRSSTLIIIQGEKIL